MVQTKAPCIASQVQTVEPRPAGKANCLRSPRDMQPSCLHITPDQPCDEAPAQPVSSACPFAAPRERGPSLSAARLRSAATLWPEPAHGHARVSPDYLDAAIMFTNRGEQHRWGGGAGRQTGANQDCRDRKFEAHEERMRGADLQCAMAGIA